MCLQSFSKAVKDLFDFFSSNELLKESLWSEKTIL
jgi:hypothetical protein